MMNIIRHPYQELMAEAKRAREVAESPEGQALLNALMDAAGAYWEFLDRNDLISEFTANGEVRIKASAMVVTLTVDGTIDVTLKDAPAIACMETARIPIRVAPPPATYRTNRAMTSEGARRKMAEVLEYSLGPAAPRPANPNLC